MNHAFHRVTTAPDDERRDLFLSASNRLGTTLQNVEKDFWVCWTLDALFNGLESRGPRLLFKGGTSLSKGYGLIERFSEDIDITVFRNDLGEPASIADLSALSRKKRDARLNVIKAACQDYVQGPLLEEIRTIAGRLTDAAADAGRIRVESDDGDPDRQSLLVWYPSVATGEGYVRPVVKIEAGAKSALDPCVAVSVRPYVADDLAARLDLSVTVSTTIVPERTFWDKIVILHGLRRWYERRGELRGDGQRISRHYYDVHQLLKSAIGARALGDARLREDCVRHARMFFDRADYDYASAVPGRFALEPRGDMIANLRRDYAAMSTMIFGPVPTFEEVLSSVARLEQHVNGPANE